MFLDELDGGLLDHVRARGAQLREGLEALAADTAAVIEVRGRGLMLGVRLDRPAKDVQQELHRAGLIVNVTQSDVLRIVPPYVVTQGQVEDALQLLRAVLTRLPALATNTP